MSNQLRVKVVNDKVILPDSFGGIDVGNELYNSGYKNSVNTNLSYTAVQDCFAVTKGRGYEATVMVDGVPVAVSNPTESNYNLDNGNYAGDYFSFPLKSGQVVTYYGDSRGNHCLITYGLKY